MPKIFILIKLSGNEIICRRNIPHSGKRGYSEVLHKPDIVLQNRPLKENRYERLRFPKFHINFFNKNGIRIQRYTKSAKTLCRKLSARPYKDGKNRSVWKKRYRILLLF